MTHVSAHTRQCRCRRCCVCKRHDSCQRCVCKRHDSCQRCRHSTQWLEHSMSDETWVMSALFVRDMSHVSTLCKRHESSHTRACSDASARHQTSLITENIVIHDLPLRWWRTQFGASARHQTCLISALTQHRCDTFHIVVVCWKTPCKRHESKSARHQTWLISALS